MPKHPSPTRTRITALATLLLVFAAGLGSGMTIDWLGGGERAAAERTEHRERGRRSALEALDLTAEQQQRIDRILAEKERQTELFWDSAGPRLRQIVHTARAEIRDVLTPAQRETYDAILTERRARREAAREADRR